MRLGWYVSGGCDLGGITRIEAGYAVEREGGIGVAGIWVLSNGRGVVYRITGVIDVSPRFVFGTFRSLLYPRRAP